MLSFTKPHKDGDRPLKIIKKNIAHLMGYNTHTTFQIETERLQLVACDEAIFEAIFDSDERLAANLNIDLAEDGLFEFGDAPIRYAYNQILEDSSQLTWWMYLIIHKKDNKLIGTCGYKGKPNDLGEVEIGYGVADAYRNKGIATELAQALIHRAFETPTVQAVLAHTLAEENASVKVLKKCDMHFVKELIDPEDGKIWKWQLKID